MSINWEPPLKPNAVITQYKIEITGNSTYKDEHGRTKTNIVTPILEHVDYQHKSFKKTQLPPNTNYTVSS